MAAMLAAASHDVDHPGVSQTFLTATDNPLASLHAVSSQRTSTQTIFSALVAAALDLLHIIFNGWIVA